MSAAAMGAVRETAAVTSVAGLAAVLWRRTGADVVHLLCREQRAGAPRGRVLSLPVAPATTLAELVDGVAAALAAPEPAGEDAPDATELAAVVDLDPGLPPAAPVHGPEVPHARLAASGALRELDAGDGDLGTRLAEQVRLAVAADPASHVGALDLLSPAERAWVASVAGTEQAATADHCVHDLVAAQARLTPGKVAVSCGQTRLTYRELEAFAGSLAHELRQAGVAGGCVVPVLAERSVELVGALLAVLKAGGAYLYLDPQDPDERLARLTRDAGAGIAVVGDSLRARLPAGLRPVLMPAAAGAGPAAPAPDAGTSPDGHAYVCYTSGSTGEPRGVLVRHRAVARLVNRPAWFDARDDDVFLLLAPVGFDASTLEIWAPLVRGCRLAVAPPGRVDLEEIARTLVSERVTVLWLTAGLFHELVAHQLPAFAGLRHVVAGGDVVSAAHVQQLLAAYPHVQFTNGYGPTENTTFTTCWTAPSRAVPRRLPIGRPIDGTRVLVLDARLRPVPVGVRGELWTSGEGLAVGYLGNPAATAERFVADPHATTPGGRLYRTGDVVRWLPDGNIEFLGRVDDQVKVRGFRVEPGAVEAELLGHPEVEQAVVVAQRTDSGQARLLAYVVPAGGAGADLADLGVRLRAWLTATLPAYLVPWAVIPRGDLPLNHNGKVDRKALAVTTKAPRNIWNDYVMPRDDLERRLTEIWGDALDVEPIGVEDDFFDLGGHSLLAAELLGVLHREFDVELQARTLYLQPTITDLAAELRRLGRA